MKKHDLDVIEIKDVNPNTLAEMVSLEKEAFGRAGLNEWTLPVFIRYGRVFLLLNEGEIVGVAELMKDWSNFDLAFLVGFSVRKEHRRKGWGKFFLTEIIERMRKEDLNSLYLTVSSANDAAVELYRQLGFLQVALLRDEYGKGEDRLLMGLRLGDFKASG